MKQEFQMSQEEMDNIIAINKGGGDPVMFLSGGMSMGNSLQEKVNQYWEILGNKYGFKPLTAEGSAKGNLYFLAEPAPIVVPKTQSEIEIEKYTLNADGYLNGHVCKSLSKIVEQLESCEYDNEAGTLNTNIAFLALKDLSKRFS